VAYNPVKNVLYVADTENHALRLVLPHSKGSTLLTCCQRLKCGEACFDLRPIFLLRLSLSVAGFLTILKEPVLYPICLNDAHTLTYFGMAVCELIQCGQYELTSGAIRVQGD
jgi:hypothetical protein